MADSALPLDGAIVGFLLRVLDRFERMATSPDALMASLKSVGLTDVAVTQLQAFLSARESDISKLSTDLPKLLAVLEGSNPDLLSLIPPAKDLWGVVSALVADAPKLAATDIPHAPALPNGDVLAQLVTMAVDRALRDASTAVWTGLSAVGFVGPGASILSALSVRSTTRSRSCGSSSRPCVGRTHSRLRVFSRVHGSSRCQASRSARSKRRSPRRVPRLAATRWFFSAWFSRSPPTPSASR